MARLVNISTARKNLPGLFDRVTSRDGEMVVIRRRDGGREAVLISRDYIERLERQAGALRAGKPFKLLGSLALAGDAASVLDEVRAGDRRESEKRLREFTPAIQKTSRRAR